MSDDALAFALVMIVLIAMMNRVGVIRINCVWEEAGGFDE